MQADTSLHRRWGDSIDDDFDKDDFMEDVETQPDENGYRIKIDYKTNDKGQKIKVVQRVRVVKRTVKVNKKVQERKTWRKFGDCAGLPPGAEKNITNIGDEVSFDQGKGNKTQSEQKSTDPFVPIICRHCGKQGDHWTLKCPFKDKIFDKPPQTSQPSAPAQPNSKTSDVYIPIGKRGQLDRPKDNYDDRNRRDETSTIRVTSLSEETKEADLMELFRPFGPISRIYLAKHKHNNLSKGFAFINFVNREDAAKAIEKLSGYIYDHLILHLEWAKPSNQ